MMETEHELKCHPMYLSRMISGSYSIYLARVVYIETYAQQEGYVVLGIVPDKEQE